MMPPPSLAYQPTHAAQTQIERSSPSQPLRWARLVCRIRLQCRHTHVRTHFVFNFRERDGSACRYANKRLVWLRAADANLSDVKKQSGSLIIERYVRSPGGARRLSVCSVTVCDFFSLSNKMNRVDLKREMNRIKKDNNVYKYIYIPDVTLSAFLLCFPLWPPW